MNHKANTPVQEGTMNRGPALALAMLRKDCSSQGRLEVGRDILANAQPSLRD